MIRCDICFSIIRERPHYSRPSTIAPSRVLDTCQDCLAQEKRMNSWPRDGGTEDRDTETLATETRDAENRETELRLGRTTL